MTTRLLRASDIRALTAKYDIRPTKSLGQNFVVDPGTVTKIVRAGGVEDRDFVMEIGPGLGSLTLGLLDAGATVLAVEIDSKLADALPNTVAEYAPDRAGNLTVLNLDAMRLRSQDLGGVAPTRLVANLPYNIAVPVILHCLAVFPSLETVLVMVQAEVADRMVAGPGSRVYGVPSAKAAWYAQASRAGSIGRSVFWPVPRVESALVRLIRRDVPTLASGEPIRRELVFGVIDAAFSQRRKTLRSALATWAGSPVQAAQILAAAGIDHGRRGETLTIDDFVAIAAAGQVHKADDGTGVGPAGGEGPAGTGA